MKHRVSNLEAFRQYEADPDAELSDLIEKVTGEWPASPVMQAGTAFHRALELSPTGIDADELEALGHRFTFRGDFAVELTPIRELRASKTYIVDGKPFTVSGQVDAIDGMRIEDHKTTGRFDPDRYLEGYQWRLYLDIFGANQFRWNVFELHAIEEGLHYEVTAAHRLEQWRYPGLGGDCFALVQRYARFYAEHIVPDMASRTEDADQYAALSAVA